MEVIFNSDLLVMKIKITYLILSPLVICYFRLILIFDLDQFLGDLPYLWFQGECMHCSFSTAISTDVLTAYAYDAKVFLYA